MCVRFAIKTLQQELVHVELGEEASVRELKVALCTPPRDGWRAAAQIKLVCNGKPLGDEESLVNTASYLREDAARFIVAIGVQELGRAARASAVARDLQADPRMLAMLLRMPEVQRLLAMPRLEGIQHRPDELQRLLRRVLLRPELQQAMKAGTVSDAMIEEALRPEGEGWDAAPGDVTPASRAERFIAIAERRRRLRDEQTAAALEQQLGDADDEAKVGRLMELLGQRVSRQRVIEAFLACDKDESLAASLLLAQLDE